MGDKETFANSLDRHIYEHIDGITAHADSIEALGLSWDVPMEECECQVWFDDETGTLSVNVDAQEVYSRTGGYTRTCRPGAWVVPLVRYSQKLRAESEIEQIEKAIRVAENRAFAFAPLGVQ